MASRSRTVLVLTLLLLTPLVGGCLQSLPGTSGAVGQTWPLEVSGVEAAQDATGATGASVRVAIVDTGITPTHPEFEGVDIVAWKDLVQGRSQPYDDNGHGTHVAGIIASQGQQRTLLNGFRLQGAAPGVELVVVKAIGANGQGDSDDVARGVDYAREQGADVLVLSLGGGTFPVLGTETERAVNRAVERGVFVVAAAGNAPQGESCEGVASPGNVKGVITVGAVDEDLQVADFSCRGEGNDPNGIGIGGRSDPHKKPELVAPGVGILSTWNGASCAGQPESLYCQASGTSQAVPYVAGGIALLLEEHAELQRKDRATVEDVKQKLMVSSRNIGPLEGKGSTAHHDAYGYGLFRADELLRVYG